MGGGELGGEWLWSSAFIACALVGEQEMQGWGALQVLMLLETMGEGPTSLWGGLCAFSRPATVGVGHAASPTHQAFPRAPQSPPGEVSNDSCEPFAGPGRTHPETQGRFFLNSAGPGLRGGSYWRVTFQPVVLLPGDAPPGVVSQPRRAPWSPRTLAVDITGHSAALQRTGPW